MLDLVLSLAGMMILCVLAAFAGAVLQKNASPNRVVVAQMLVTVGIGGYLIWLWDRPVLIRLLPFSCAIILSNWLPVLGSFFAGICLKTERIVRLRRVLLATALSGLCCYSLTSPLLGKAPECQETCQGKRILDFQTTSSTCSAACAAGLLRLHGIPASEEELARLCLTRRGTHWLGVFRGLKIKTAGTEWDVVVEDVIPGQLLQKSSSVGVLALTFTAEAEARAAESGFGTAVGHTVVSLGSSTHGTLEVFDPSPDYGFESWNHAILADVKTAIRLRLVSRKGSPSPLHGFDTNRPSTWNTLSIARR